MSFRDRLQACAQFTPSAYRPLIIAGCALGRVTQAFASSLQNYPDVFTVYEHAVTLSPNFKMPETRTEAVAKVLEDLKEKGLIPGWRGEHYPISEGFYDAPLLTVERAAVPYLGTMGYGVHLNGYVRKDGGIHMWIGKRSMQKPTGPGKLDQMVAGGQPVGISVWENLIKECGEEAGMSKELAEKSVAVGTVSYLTEQEDRLRHDIIFNYDVELPIDFEPTPMDGEVDAFYLWPIKDVMDRIRNTDDFKYNAALVIIDFAVRHGVLDPEDPEYILVTEALRLGRAGDISAR